MTKAFESAPTGFRLVMRDLHDPIQRQRVYLRLTEAVMKSFQEEKAAITEREVKRRVDIVCEVFAEIYNDLKWTPTRILDVIGVALRHKLNGNNSWEPTKKKWGIAPDSAVDMVMDKNEDLTTKAPSGLPQLGSGLWMPS